MCSQSTTPTADVRPALTAEHTTHSSQLWDSPPQTRQTADGVSPACQLMHRFTAYGAATLLLFIILFLFFTWVKETQRNCSATLFPIYPISTQLRKRHIKSHCGKGYIEHELLSLKHHSGNQVIWRPLLNLWHRRISNFKSLILGHDISFLLHRQTLKSSELDARRNTSPPVLSQSFKWSKCDPVHFRLCEWHQRTKSETWTHAVA